MIGLFLSKRKGNAVTDHLDLPQGTLDLLILKAVSLGPMHGWAISERLHDVTGPPSRFPRARSIPRCTVSSAAADSRRMGAAPITTARPSSMS